MAVTIRLRRDTAANWTSANPTLAVGEVGIETDTVKLKFGDGSTAWADLDYFSAAAALATIAEIDDVTITTPGDNEVLAYDSGTATWINQTLSEAGLGDMDAATYDPAAIAEQLVGLTAAQTLTNKTLSDFTNNVDADDVHVQVRNESGAPLTAGTPVYASGYSVGQDMVLVEGADASAGATMPAIAILAMDLGNNSTGPAIQLGRIEDVDTSAWADGDELYVSETAGELTATKPTGSALIQKVATVLRVHATLGVLAVGTTSAEDLPNIAQDSVWVGNASSVPTATAKTALGLLPEDAGIVNVSATHTLLAANAGKVHLCSGTFTVTLPDGLDTGYQVTLINTGAGVITLSATTTLQSSGAAVTLATQYEGCVAVHIGANVWIAMGGLE